MSRSRAFFTLLSVAGSLAVPGVPALAQANDNDVRCLVLSSMFAQGDPDPKRKQLATVARFYFLGRVDARLTDQALKSQLLTPSKPIDKIQMGKDMTACAKQLQMREVTLNAIGKSLPKPPAPPAPNKK